MEVSYIKEWLKVTKAAKNEENPYINPIADAPEFQAQEDEWNHRLTELEEQSHKDLNQYQKFELAGMVNEYRSIYNSLCSCSHNNIRALFDRFLEVNEAETDFKVVMFKASGQSENELYFALGAECLRHGGYIIHSALETGYAKEFESASAAPSERECIPYSGRVKWFNDAKGYGFIESGELEKDLFVHHTAIQADGRRTLKPGQDVMFETEDSPKGVMAINVTVEAS